MNAEKEDIGVMQKYSLDMAFGADENNFECTTSINNHCCKEGFFLYYENSELGGIIDTIEVDTAKEEVSYIGRTWHGILEKKIIEPDSGADYLIVSGDAHEVISSVIDRIGLSALFKASETMSGINVSNYKMHRYTDGYKGIVSMLNEYGAKLKIVFKNGFAELLAEKIVDYSKDEQFDTGQIDFSLKKNYKPLNHVVCLGSGELKDRIVIHVYMDESGNVSDTKVFTGIDEVTQVYDYPNAESSDNLKQGGIDMLLKAHNSDVIKFNFNSNDEVYDIGDIVGAKERLTGISVASEITKKIIKIKDNMTTISYKVGEEK